MWSRRGSVWGCTRATDNAGHDFRPDPGLPEKNNQLACMQAVRLCGSEKVPEISLIASRGHGFYGDAGDVRPRRGTSRHVASADTGQRRDSRTRGWFELSSGERAGDSITSALFNTIAFLYALAYTS